MRKYDKISELLRKRVINGDYSLTGIPADRQLAQEFGISYMTARRAVQQLIDEDLLARGANGRAAPKRRRDDGSRQLQAAFLMPSWGSRSIDMWRIAVERCTASRGACICPISYRHWDDPVIADALDAFDGAFIVPSSEPTPDVLISAIQESKCPVVFLEEDHSQDGIPSIDMAPLAFIHRLLDHLESFGHQSIACLNTQPYHSITAGRIAQWRIWMAAHGYCGELIDEPVVSYCDPLPQAYDAMKRELKRGRFDATAILCITDAAAMGCMRALHEYGIEPGRDIAVATIGTSGTGDYCIPSLTALEQSDPMPYISLGFDWIAGGGGAWKGPLLLRPIEPTLVVRESSGRPIRPRVVSQESADHSFTLATQGGTTL